MEFPRLPHPASQLKTAMLLPASLRFTLALTLFALPLSCGSSSSSGDSDGTGDSGDDIQVTFSGPQAGSPIAASKVVISWLDASNSAGDPPSSFLYKVYRSTSLDLSDEALVGTTSPGITSFVDDGLATNGQQTYFYRIVAIDVYLNESVNNSVVSAHPPADVTSGNLNFDTNVLPLFALEGETEIPPGSGTYLSCLDCHTSSSPVQPTEAVYTDHDGFLAGVGTLSSPDTFLVGGDGSATSSNFLSRFQSYSGADEAHGEFDGAQGAGYHNMTQELQVIADNLKDWANEGALEFADDARPIMDFTDIKNTSYEASYDLVADEVTITTFHGSDPESQLNHLGVDSLSYRIYGGLTSNTIDWDTPLVETDRNIYSTSSDVVITFSYTGNSGVFVVRAVDYEGNETLNEEELEVTR